MKTTFMRFGIPLFVFCTFLGSGKACGLSEYKSGAGECCPMCNVGLVVRSDCVEDSSTTCTPCTPGTYMNEPNGLHKCFTCQNCDESQGLYIKSKCSTIKNTVCDVLDGYYCIEYTASSECTRAVKHSVCEPGQETKTPGTKSSDTVCVECAHGFYSLSGLSCTKWTDCTVRNEIQTEDGSSVKDVTCTSKIRGRYGLISSVVLTTLFSAFLFLTLRYKSQKANLKYPTEETIQIQGSDTTNASDTTKAIQPSNTPEESLE